MSAYKPFSWEHLISELVKLCPSQSFSSDGNALTIRCELPTFELSLLELYHTIPTLPKIYLKLKDDDEEVCAWGSLAEMLESDDLEKIKWPRQTNSPLESAQLRWYGGLAFDAQAADDDLWRGFHRCRFFLPEFEVRRSGSSWQFFWHTKTFAFSQDQAIAYLRHQLCCIAVDERVGSAPLPFCVSQKESITREKFLQNVNSVLKIISAQQLEKVVLARSICLSFGEEVNPVQFLSSFHRMKSPAYFFAIQFPRSATFLGSSPEMLFRRKKDQVEAEAIAGTEVRGLTSGEDTRLGTALLESKKNRWEQSLVQQYLMTTLSSLCKEIHHSPVDLLKLIKVQHLKSNLWGTLKPGIPHMQILQALHPTPAVCGLPKEKSMHLIRELEPFHRGWYAGALGFLGKDSSEFFVGLRSGVLDGREFHMFAGAGIVDGSDPQLEWEEIENKFKNYTEVIGQK